LCDDAALASGTQEIFVQSDFATPIAVAGRYLTAKGMNRYKSDAHHPSARGAMT
jgi:hypothetical protein